MDKILEFQKKIIISKIQENDVCADLTCGRGNDTLFLARMCKKVYSFDIQEEAINSAKEKTKDLDNIVYILKGHEYVDSYINEPIGVAVYNLGYLPKGDHNITTHYEQIKISLDKVLQILRKKGVIIITCYPGHEEGLKESINLDEYLRKLNQKEYEVLRYEFINQINNPPYLYIIEKIWDYL